MLETIILSLICGSLVSLIVMNLWGLRYIERQLKRIDDQRKQPTIKELLEDSEPIEESDKP